MNIHFINLNVLSNHNKTLFTESTYCKSNNNFWPNTILFHLDYLITMPFMFDKQIQQRKSSIRLVTSEDRESAGGVVVTTSASTAGGTVSIPGTGSCDIKIWLSTLGTMYPS